MSSNPYLEAYSSSSSDIKRYNELLKREKKRKEKNERMLYLLVPFVLHRCLTLSSDIF